MSSELYPLAGYAGYFTRPDGAIYSTRRGALRPLASRADREGYLTVRLRVGPQRERTLHVHRLVADACLPPRPSPAHQVRHLDGSRDNNTPSNLAWGTSKENAADRERHGRTTRGSASPHAKLDEDKVAEIRRCLATGASLRSLAARFGVHFSEIGHIKSGRSWRHVK